MEWHAGGNAEEMLTSISISSEYRIASKWTVNENLLSHLRWDEQNFKNYTTSWPALYETLREGF